MITLTQATLSDARDLAQIHCDSWRQAYQSLLPESYIAEQTDVESKTALWQHVVAHPQTVTIIAQDSALAPEQNKVGFISYFIEDSGGDKATITTLYVLPEYQNQGIGGQLINHVIESLKTKSVATVSLWVLNSNQLAIQFYQQHGFVPTGEQQSEFVSDFEIIDIQLQKQLN